MHRFYLPPERSTGDRLVLEGREAHHAAHVLRLRPGEPAVLLNGVGSELDCVVTTADRGQITFEVKRRTRRPPPAFQITLVQAIPKGKAMETIIQKAVELGAQRMVPLKTDRSVVHFDNAGAESKIEKWRWIAIDAMKQCGLAWLPAIAPPQTIAEFFSAPHPTDLALVGALAQSARHPREILDQYQSSHQCFPGSVAVWIGPEGDFTPEELSSLTSRQVEPITLGPHVLRSETAALYCLAILNYEWQARTKQKPSTLEG